MKTKMPHTMAAMIQPATEEALHDVLSAIDALHWSVVARSAGSAVGLAAVSCAVLASGRPAVGSCRVGAGRGGVPWAAAPSYAITTGVHDVLVPWLRMPRV